MRRTSTGFVSQGFTLIELAVVIAIIGILAAVAIPRFADTTAAAEGAVIKDGLSQLNSAMSIYTASNSGPPLRFGDFVTTASGDSSKTLNLSKFGTNSGTGHMCSVGGGVSDPTAPTPSPLPTTTITCNGTFNKYSVVTYTLQDGTISVSAPGSGSVPSIGTPSGGAPAAPGS